MTPPLMHRPDVIVFPDPHLLSEDAALRFIAHAAMKTRVGSPFSVALAGGSTPALLYSLLSSIPYRASIDWKLIHLFFGDDRCVPVDSDFSNFRLANDSLISKVPIPPENVHRIKTELSDNEEAAHEYEGELRKFFTTPYPRFDLILLGMGSDGHCASLFPQKSSLSEMGSWVTVAEPGLKPFVPRITITYPVINHAHQIIFMVAGADKAETLHEVMDGSYNPKALPSQGVSPLDGSCTWLIDKQAASKLSSQS